MNEKKINSILKKGEKYVGSRPGVSLCQIMREIYFTVDDEKIKKKVKLVVVGAKEIIGELKINKELFKKDRKKYRKDKKMKIRMHKPVSIKKIENPRYKGHNTICQYLRDIYAMTNDEEIKMKCRVGMSMAKSMYERLKKYRKIMNAKEITASEGDLKQYIEEK